MAHINDSMTDKILTLRENYESASELRIFWDLLILKLLFPSIFCWYFRYFVSETYIFSGLPLHLHTYPINAVFLVLYLWYIWHYDITTLCRQNTRKCLHFHIKKRLFLSIFCWYKCTSVGTNYILVGSHVPTDFQMYRQNFEKALIAPLPPPPPSGYASVIRPLPAKLNFTMHSTQSPNSVSRPQTQYSVIFNFKVTSL